MKYESTATVTKKKKKKRKKEKKKKKKKRKKKKRKKKKKKKKRRKERKERKKKKKKKKDAFWVFFRRLIIQDCVDISFVLINDFWLTPIWLQQILVLFMDEYFSVARA